MMTGPLCVPPKQRLRNCHCYLQNRSKYYVLVFVRLVCTASIKVPSPGPSRCGTELTPPPKHAYRVRRYRPGYYLKTSFRDPQATVTVIDSETHWQTSHYQ
eukprot:3685556-Rhodomonas_salina.1